MKRVHLYQQIIGLVTLSILLGACATARVEPTPTLTPIPTSTVAPAPTETPVPAKPTFTPETPNADNWMSWQNSVEWLEWSADGRTLAISAASGVYLLDTQTDTAVRPLEKGELISAVALDRQGKRLLAGNRVWDVATEKLLYQIATENVNRADFSPDGKTLAVGEDNSITLWDAATGKFQKSIGVGLGNPFWGLFFNADGSGLYAAYEDGKVWQADLASGKFTENFKRPKGCCRIIFSPDMQTVLINLSNHGEGHKELWNVENPKMLINAEHCDNDHSFDAFSADSKYFVTGPCGLDAQLWDIQARKMLHGFRNSTSYREWYSVAFSPDGSKVALGNNLGEILIWDLTSYQLIKTFSIPKS